MSEFTWAGSPAVVLAPRDVRYLDSILMDHRGLVHAQDSATLRAIAEDDRRYWAHLHGVYQFPSTQLIRWLRDRIDGRKAIEIGAGHGAIGRALRIPVTDAQIQNRREVAAYYALTQQPTIRYPRDVVKQSAADALVAHRPRVVIGAWITQLHRPGDEQGSVYGVDEEALLTRVDEYIMIGTTAVHGGKRIMRHPHEELSFPWLVSRAADQSRNRIYVWKGVA